jgi:ribonuclease HI
MNLITIYTDGGARGNPGPAGIGFVFLDGEKKIYEGKKFIGERQTNNWAEYEAVRLALDEAQARGHQAVEIRMDSQLVVEQLSGNWKIKEQSLKEQAAKVRALLSQFSQYSFAYIPRERNSDADRLVNEAIDEAGY